MSNEIRKVPCVIPTIPADFSRFRMHFGKFATNLPVSRFVFIGPEALRDCIDDLSEEGIGVEFINENQIVPFSEVKSIYDDLLANCTLPRKSTVNWYYQQFLKIGYCRLCDDDYYLCWDADTLPLRRIDMFDPEGKPYLDVKPEFQNSYFTTINRLFGFNKVIQKSFISEHMLFGKMLLEEMLGEIEGKKQGTPYYDVIMRAVGSDNLKLGFSEFETYGTWVAMRHTDAYRLRNWKSFRNANFYVDWKDLNEDDIRWLSIDYDAATFEKYHETEDILTQLFRDKRYREKLSPEQFYHSVLESGAMGEYENGFLKVGDDYYPT